MGCGGNGDRIHRHNSIRDAIFTAAQSAVLAPRRESPHLIPNRQSRPADIFLLNWDRGRPAALDISVICPLQRLTIQGAAASPGHALQVGESRKRDLHHAPCASAGISFIPGRAKFSIISDHLSHRPPSWPAHWCFPCRHQKTTLPKVLNQPLEGQCSFMASPLQHYFP